MPLRASSVPSAKAASSLPVILAVLSLVVWVLPLGLRDYVYECVKYVAYGQWLPFVLPYASWELFWRHCNMHILITHWVKITVIPTLLMFFITKHNGALPYTRYYPEHSVRSKSFVRRLLSWIISIPLGVLRWITSPIASFKNLLARGWCGGRSCNDRLIKIVSFFALTVATGTAYWTVVNLAVNETPDADPSAQWAGPVERGLMSQSQRNWYNDNLPLRYLYLLAILVEGWRVRMHFTRVFFYMIVGSYFTGLGIGVSMPLFVYEYRQLQRSNDLVWWWIRTQKNKNQGESAKKSKDAEVFEPEYPSQTARDVARQFAEEPVLPSGEVDIPLVSRAVRRHMRANPGEATARELALDVMVNPSPVNFRPFPTLTLWGLNISGSVVLSAIYFAGLLYSAYVWIVWIVQFESNSCWFWEHQEEMTARPSSWVQTMGPFLPFASVMAWECALGHYFPNLADSKARRTGSWFGTLSCFALCYYNQLNVAVVLGGMLGVREVRLMLGGSISAQVHKHVGKAVPEFLDLPGQQSIWWSSHAPDAYTGKPQASDIDEDDLARVVPAPREDDAASESAEPAAASSKKATPKKASRSRKSVAGADSASPAAESVEAEVAAPAAVAAPAEAATDLPLVLRPAVYLLDETCSSFDSFFGSIGGALCRVWSRWQRHWGWDPLPLPLHRQASLGSWCTALLTSIFYWLALGIVITTALYQKDGNQDPFSRWWLDNVSFIFAVLITLHEIDLIAPKKDKNDDEEEKEVQDDSVDECKRAREVDSVEEALIAGDLPSNKPLVGAWLLSRPLVWFLLLTVQFLVSLMGTPRIDAYNPGLNPAWSMLRITVTNLIYGAETLTTPVADLNEAKHAPINIALIILSIVLVWIMNRGFNLRKKKNAGARLTTLSNVIVLLPLLVALVLVWPQATSPCFMQTGREYTQVDQAELDANRLTTRHIVTERAHPKDTADPDVTRQPALRAAHPHAHGCVQATLSLPYYIPPKYKHGLFGADMPSGLPVNSSGVKSWPAFVRFSNGQFSHPNGHGGWVLNPDNSPDIRGMAVKVVLPANRTAADKMALSPEEIAQAHTDVNTQDFIGITSDYFFTRDAEHVAGFFRAASAENPAVGIAEWLAPSEFSFKALKVLGQRIGVLGRGLVALARMNLQGGKVLNPLNSLYYSATPYRIGPEQSAVQSKSINAQAIKFRWRPCAAADAQPQRKSVGFQASLILLKDLVASTVVNPVLNLLLHTTEANMGKPIEYMKVTPMNPTLKRELHMRKAQPKSFLRANLAASLDPFDPEDLAAPACFELQIQDQVDACSSRVEDATSPWRSPSWTRVARLDIPRQLFLSDPALDVCERLSYNPWHALKEHKPLGDVNRVRKVAYMESAHTRMRLNDKRPVGPVFKGDELPTAVYSEADLPHGEAAKLALPVPKPINAAAIEGKTTPLYGDVSLYTFTDYPVPYAGLPRMAGQLPANESFTPFTATLIGNNVLNSIRAQKYAQARVRPEFKKIQQFEHVGLGLPDEPFLQHNTNHLASGRLRRPPTTDEHVWTSDEYFASQFVRGINPTKLIHVTDKTPITQRLRPLDQEAKNNVKRILRTEGAESIEDLQRAGRLFFTEYPELDDIMTVAERVYYVPVIVFYATKEKRSLMPLFIQLETYTPCAADAKDCLLPRLFFPHPWVSNLPEDVPASTEALTWLFAKMHAAQADGQQHQLIAHLLETHLVLETTIIASHRALRKQHLVMRLLQQHFNGTMAINNFGRMTLVSDVNPFVDTFQTIGAAGANELMARQFQSERYTYMETVPNQLARRGFKVPSPEQDTDFAADKELSDFLYRDYAVPLWYRYRKYVLSVLETEDRFAAAKSEAEKSAAVKADPEIAAWMHELFDASAGALPLRNRVSPDASYTDFVDFLTQLIFQASAQHASVNFPQYNYLAFQPGRPLGLSLAMPLNTSTLSESAIVHSLPSDAGIQLLQLTFDILSTCCVNTLMGEHSGTNIGLLDGEHAFVAPTFPQQWSALQAELRTLEPLQVANNQRLNAAIGRVAPVDYPWLYPSRIPMSIAI